MNMRLIEDFVCIIIFIFLLNYALAKVGIYEVLQTIIANKIKEHFKKANIGFQSVIDAQPTAYDIDQVVKYLENEIQIQERYIEIEKKNGTITEEYQHRKAVEVLRDAIEIVKAGEIEFH